MAAVTPRAATFGVFFVNGAMVGTWVGQIPFLQDRLGISKATLGLALLCMAVGAMTVALATAEAGAFVRGSRMWWPSAVRRS